MTSIAELAEELAVSPGDVRTVLPHAWVSRVAGLLTEAVADEVRALLDPDGVRVTHP